MKFWEYLRELKLAEQQYGQEEELYPLINMLLREHGNLGKDISVRMVSNARRFKGGNKRNLLFGYQAFPDIALLGVDFGTENHDHDIYGCVEAKKMDKDLLPIKPEIKTITIKRTDGKLICEELNMSMNNRDVRELIGELLWYGKVLYTNGIVWKYISLKNPKDKKDLRDNILKDYIGGSEMDWVEAVAENKNHIEISCKDIGDLSEIIKNEKFTLNDIESLSESYKDKWENFLKELKNIKWINKKPDKRYAII